MSPDAITEARKDYAKYSKEELNKISVVELRKIAPKLGISHVDRNGEKQRVGLARKEELVNAIWEACEDSRIASAARVAAAITEVPIETTSQPETEVQIEETEYPDFEAEINEVAKKYYEGIFDAESKKWGFVGLREYVVRLMAQQKPMLPEFFTMVSAFRPELERRIKDRTGESEVKFNTLSNWRSQILKRIEKMVDRDNDSYSDNLLSQTFKLFYDSVQASFADVQRQKAESSNKSLNQRQNNAINIKVVNLIQWAKDRLVRLPEVPSLWHQVAIALMILTGRRQSEIMSSAKFSPVGSDSYVEFSGQLKRHDGETVGAYEIPALANSAEAVIAGLKWLEDNNKRVAPADESYQSQQASAKKSHDRFSRYLSESAKEICNKYIVLGEGADWELPDESLKKKDRRKCHLFRQIYGQVVYPVYFEKSGRKLNQVLTEVMGHSNRASSRRHAAEAYDADCFVTDIDEIKVICGKG
jgi:hypothetical protein